MKIFFAINAFVFLTLVSCKKDDQLTEPEDHSQHHAHNDTTHTHDTTHYGTVTLQLANMVDTNLLGLDTVNYVLDNGDKLKVSMYKYYISNVRLQKQDGTWFTEPESYHLIDESTVSSKTIPIQQVPEATYTAIQFLIGVDSTRNVSGVQSGDLDPAKGMFWTWSTGYIMAKVEGTSLQSTGPGHSIGFHIGGFSGVNSGIRTASPSFNGLQAQLNHTQHPTIHLKCDLAEWFRNPHPISFATLNNLTMVNADSKMIADNYADMFSVTGISY